MKGVLKRGVLKLSVGAALVLSYAVAARADVCHVYVLDIERGLKAKEMEGDEQARLKAMEAAQVVFPEFETTVGEEEQTLKTYPFPGVANLFIMASVFYTDESMVSAESADSMLLGVGVGPRIGKAWPPDHALAEVTHAGADTVRVKKYVKVRGREHLVGMECHVKPRARGRQ